MDGGGGVIEYWFLLDYVYKYLLALLNHTKSVKKEIVCIDVSNGFIDSYM